MATERNRAAELFWLYPLGSARSPLIVWLLQMLLTGVGPQTHNQGFRWWWLERLSALIRLHPSCVVSAHLQSHGFCRHFWVGLAPKSTAARSVVCIHSGLKGHCCVSLPLTCLWIAFVNLPRNFLYS